jgi:type II secretory pathway component PulF
VNRILKEIVKKLFPKLEITLRKAGKEESLDDYINKYSKFPVIMSGFFNLLFFFVFLKLANDKGSKLYLVLFIPFLIVSTFFLIVIFFSFLKIIVINRRAELESDLLYSSRFLLLKLESGSPLLNALIDVSELDTKSSKFFKEIVTNIYLGTPIEEAIDLAIKYSPSESYVKILQEIKNSLRTGADIEKSMKATLESMTKEHVIQIKSYGKKLSPISMIYMIVGTIVPSLGTAILVIGLGFVDVGEKIADWLFTVLLIILILGQIFFILLFRAVKPQVMY